MKDFKKIVNNIVSQSQLEELPKELQPAKIFIWNNDLNSAKDWDDFTGGQLVCHTYYDKKYISAMLDISSLQFGTSASSYWGMLNANEQITIYTNEFIDLEGKFVSIGENLNDKYYAISYELLSFKLDKSVSKKPFYGKIVLVNIQKFLDNQFNDSNEAPIINIVNGKLNETITLPSFKKTDSRQPADPNVRNIEEIQITTPKAQTIEILFPDPAIMIGGIDFIANLDRKGQALADKNRLIKVISGSTKPKTLPINPYYCIIPTQWNIPSIDNYGWTHPSDPSNIIKTIMATQTLGSAAASGLSFAGLLGLGKITSGVGSASIGLGQKFFGDKGTLANSTAINSSFLSGEGDPIKFFIQGDAAVDGKIINSKGYMDIKKLRDQNDYLEVNQGNGEFGKYGKSMSPSNNEQFNNKYIYRALGLTTIKLANDADTIPAMATPFTGSFFEDLQINDTKINDYMKTGAMRQNVNSGEVLPPMIFPENWDVYVRNMFFRPDAYSFWNWPCMMPAEIGVWDIVKQTDISYDTTVSPDTGILASLGLISQAFVSAKNRSMWNKTITVSQITENNLYDPNKTYSSYRYELESNDYLNDFYQIQFTAITSSTVKVNVLNENDEVVRTHIFNSQGLNVGTSASWGTVLQL